MLGGGAKEQGWNGLSVAKNPSRCTVVAEAVHLQRGLETVPRAPKSVWSSGVSRSLFFFLLHWVLGKPNRVFPVRMRPLRLASPAWQEIPPFSDKVPAVEPPCPAFSCVLLIFGADVEGVAKPSRECRPVEPWLTLKAGVRFCDSRMTLGISRAFFEGPESSGGRPSVEPRTWRSRVARRG